MAEEKAVLGGAADTASPPARRISLRDQAYETIKQQIVRCELRPGEAITVTDVANALNLGRTPVIQAIDRLAVDGLVEVMPRKGVVVSPVSMNDFVEIVEMRALNEGQAARWAAERASPVAVERMAANVEATWTAAKRGALEDMIDCDREFHRMLSGAARNAILTEFLSNLHDRSLRFWFLSLRAPDHNMRVCEQHSAIVESIRARNADAAEQAMRDHITAFSRNLTDQIGLS
ncbi:GntR family transcriptional regulator [Pararhodobacter zhoushanensis]|uniref:GntR family transcriptional regulator n=1 Tax=Pararhodobacter zhoushanensis TaxID=2479545 RepID=UPI00248216FD|nr:GntR family transcriptional regulator [Pararhodobacter zhoushanensis]